MATSSWSACACPSSDPRQTSRLLPDQWFWPCLIQSCQVFTRQTFRDLVSASAYVHESTVSVDRKRCFQPRDEIEALVPRPWSSLTSPLRASVAGIMLLLLCFFAFLHCWLNLFAELLRFADRMFYKVRGLVGGVSAHDMTASTCDCIWLATTCWFPCDGYLVVYYQVQQLKSVYMIHPTHLKPAFESVLAKIVLFCTGFVLSFSFLLFFPPWFLQDWWNSTSFTNYYRTWNVVVHDWLFYYGYRDFLWVSRSGPRQLTETCWNDKHVQDHSHIKAQNIKVT